VALDYSALFRADTVAAALAVDPAGTVHVTGGAGLVSAFPQDSPPTLGIAPWIFGIANSAGGSLAGRLAPGELFSIYGLHLGPEAPTTGVFNTAGLLPATPGGIAITMNGTPVPLLYVSATQINAVVPIEITAGSASELRSCGTTRPCPASARWLTLPRRKYSVTRTAARWPSTRMEP
jgi:hypothetical protein